MTEDLTTWLLEQLAEDDRAITGVAAGAWWLNDYVDDAGEAWIDRWANIDRAKAERDIKRQIIEAVQRREQGHPGHHANIIGEPPEAYDEYDSCAYCIRWSETTLPPYALRLLALSYAGREGYREEWRP